MAKYLSKAKQITICGTSLLAIGAITLATVLPIVSAKDYKTDQVLNNSQYDFVPKLVSQDQIEELLTAGIIKYNPYQFEKSFFVNNIANVKITDLDQPQSQAQAGNQINNAQKVINSNQFLFHFDKSDEAINYEVTNVELIQDRLVATVQKSFQDYHRTYQKEIVLPENVFVDRSTSQANFLKVASQDLRLAFTNGWISIGSTDNPPSANINDWKVENLGPVSNLVDQIQISPSKNDFQIINLPDQPKLLNLEYQSGQDVSFSLVTVDNNSGQPDVSKEQIIGFNQNQSWISQPNATEQQWLELPAIKWLKSVSKEMGLENPDLPTLKAMIFNVTEDPSDQNNQPLSNYQLVPFKLKLGNQVNYIMVWTDVVTRSLQKIINNAPEINWILDLKNQKVSKAQFKAHPENYLRPEHQVPSGLHYQYQDNSLTLSDQDTKATFQIAISFIDDRLQLTKTYQITNLDVSSLT